MNKSTDPKKKAGLKALRKKAEKALKEQTARLDKLSRQDVKHLVTELGTHQIELELQNEELREARAELQASHDKLADLYDYAPIGYFTLDARGLIQDVNLAGAHFLGTSKRALFNKPFPSFLAEQADQRAFQAHLREVFLKHTRRTCEVGLKIKTGPLFYAQLQSVAVEDPEGKTGTIRMTVTDVSERKKAELALKKSEESFHALVEFSPEALALHINGVYMYANPAAVRLFGAKDMKELLGKKFMDLVHPAYQRNVDERAHRMSEDSGQNSWKELKLVRLDGQTIDVETDAIVMPVPVPVQMIGQQPVLVVFRDISRRKKAEEALKTAHAELERRASELGAVNRELESFSYTVSHDLKAPLRTIEGFSRAVLEDYSDKLDDAGKDYLRRAHSASQRMTQLIDAMLNMARLTHGELQEKVVNLSSLAQVVAHDLQIKEPGRRAEFIIAEKVKANGDQDMLKIVLENLLDNAWKFTSKHPAAKIEFGAVDMDGNRVYYVRDDGAGFDPAFSDKLFMPFKRLHLESEFPGLGMGLAIAHRIIMRHNGRMWAEAAPEKGATFYFTL